MSQLIPRFRGNAIERPDGKGWTWELFISIGPDSPENHPIVMGPKSDRHFLNQDSALNDMTLMIPDIAAEVCKAMGLPGFTAFQNLKEGTLETVEEFKKRVVDHRGPQ